MTVNYTTLLGLAQPVTGTEANAWGDVVNDQITALVEEAVAGGETIDVTSGDVTLSTTVGAANQARNAILLITGTPGTSRNVVAPTQSKVYLVKNSSNAAIVLKGSATTGVTIPVGVEALCFFNGSDFEIVGVNGPASSTDNAIARFDSTTGKVIQNSGVTIDDSNNISGVAQLNTSGQVVFNDAGADVDFRVEGDTDANLLFVDASADAVGIGTSSPASKLEVSGSGTLELARFATTTDNTPSIGIYSSGSIRAKLRASTAETALLSQGATPLLLGTNNAERMRIDSAGNVGIGTSSPSTLLNVQKADVSGFSVNTSFDVMVLENGTSGTGTALQLVAATNGFSEIGFSDSTRNQGLISYSHPTDAMLFFTNATERMRITSAGNVGIGTSSPDTRLTVDTSGGPGNTVNRHITMGRGTTVRAWLGTNKDTPTDNVSALVFGVDDTERARITSTGNVGIGTSSPESRLDVADGSGGILTLKSLATSVVAADEVMGQINFYTSDTSGGNTGVFAKIDAASNRIFDGDSASGMNLRFFTGTVGTGAGTPPERMRIDSAGNLLVGTTSIIVSAKQTIQFTGGSNGLAVSTPDNLSSVDFVTFRANGATCGTISRVGTTSAVAYITTSDYRLKENIASMTGALVTVAQLKPVTYDWKAGGSSQGFIAHELQAVCPDAVTGEKDAINEDGSIKPQGIDTSFLVATLTAAIQELKTIVDAQAARIAALEAQ